MIYINAFIYVGIICLIGQIIMDNTMLTPGHVTSIFVVIGAILAFLGCYSAIENWAGYATSVPIISFGNLLFEGAWNGFKEGGVLGLFSGMFTTTSAGISTAIIFSFIFMLFFKPKD